MHSFTATASFDGSAWLVQCDQLAEAKSLVPELDQAAEFLTEAISYVLGVPESEIEVTVAAAESESESESD